MFTFKELVDNGNIYEVKTNKDGITYSQKTYNQDGSEGPIVKIDISKENILSENNKYIAELEKLDGIRKQLLHVITLNNEIYELMK